MLDSCRSIWNILFATRFGIFRLCNGRIPRIFLLKSKDITYIEISNIVANKRNNHKSFVPLNEFAMKLVMEVSAFLHNISIVPNLTST